MASDSGDTRSQLGNTEGDGTPLFELQSETIKVFDTRRVTQSGSPQIGFQLGHTVFGTLGSVDGGGLDPGRNQLGQIQTHTEYIQVANHEDKFTEEFNNNRFEDTGSNDATWDTSNRRLVF